MKKSEITQQRLIREAASIFARKGYHKTKISEVCEAADVNIASVNYHFGDKTKLYAKVWGYLWKAENESFPVPEDHTELGAEAWLRVFLRARLQCIFSKDDAGLFPMLVHRDMHALVPEKNELVRTYLIPQQRRVFAAIQSLFPAQTSRVELELATANFNGVYISLNGWYQQHRNLPNHTAEFTAIADSESAIQQIETFALGGLKALQERLGR